MSNPVIVLDVDSVMLDWFSNLACFLKEKGMDFEHIHPFVGTNDFVPLEDLFCTKELSEQLALMNEYNTSKYIETLSVMEEHAIKVIAHYKGKVDFIALTCVSKCKNAASMRERNLKAHYSDGFKEVICLGARESKEEALKKLNKEYNVLFFVDDQSKHIIEAENAKVEAYQYAYKITERKSDQYAKKVYSWKCIAQKIEEKLNKLNK